MESDSGFWVCMASAALAGLESFNSCCLQDFYRFSYAQIKWWIVATHV